jgi:drug/metabolite transporter (DMT)-like permease
MDLFVFLAVLVAVLAAALCHAAWNAGLKMRVDPALAVTILAIASGAFALPLLAITGFPGRESWPYLAASIVIHVFYFMALAEAYRGGDLGMVYPIARGAAPLLTTVGSLLVLAEPVPATGLAGILLLTSGVLLLSLPRSAAQARLDCRAIGFALLTALIIATYTIIDGRGARLAGSAHSYAVAVFTGNGLIMGLIGLARQRAELCAVLRSAWLPPLGGGVLSFVSYWVALWAMTKAPIALVAALREASVLFAAALGVILLKEPLVGARIAAAVLVVAGLALIRLG